MSLALTPFRLQSPCGMAVQLNANGSIRRIDCGEITVNLFVGNEVEGGPANIYLRRHGADIEWTPLLGPGSPGRMHFDRAAFAATGEWRGIRYRLDLQLAASAAAWFWHVTLDNATDLDARIDLIYAQDLALAHYAAVRSNEYYVSHYIDHTPLAHSRHGFAVGSRQNMAMSGRHPWSLIGSLGKAVGFATDTLQFRGLATRAGAAPAGLRSALLPNRRRQHEHSMVALQEEAFVLASGERAQRGFFAWVEPNHDSATSATDLAVFDRALELPEARPRGQAASAPGFSPATTLFSSAPRLSGVDLGAAEIDALFGADRRHVEADGGRLLSFFTGAGRHVVLRAKELEALRPHGQILRSGNKLVPEEESLTSTAWMAGVFHSQVTQGHVSINRFLSATRSYLGLFRSTGQRIFMEVGGIYHLLDVPSAFEMTPSACRWLYKHGSGLLQVRSWAEVDRHELGLAIEVLAGGPCRFLLSHHIALDGDDGAEAAAPQIEGGERGVRVRPVAGSEIGRRFPRGSFRIDAVGAARLERWGRDELLFADGRSRQQPFVVLISEPATALAFRITGHLIGEGPGGGDLGGPPRNDVGSEISWRSIHGLLDLRAPAGSPCAGDVERLQEILPWYAHDALIHYLAPRGLEQYTGGGWGTRDVCQGPVEFLLALGQWAPLRDLLLRVFRQQNPDGDWPQWFMFFERERHIRPAEAHGDIVFWPLLVLAQYVLAAEDPGILDEVVPFFDLRGDEAAERSSLEVHVERALALIGQRVIAGTRLPVYGHGDWNDSLQPADPSMSRQLCSAWTGTLCYQTLRALSAALRFAGRDQRAQQLEVFADGVRDDFQRLMISEGVVAGLALFRDDGEIEYLFHPRDAATGVHYSLLPMVYGILSELFTPGQAAAHASYVRDHLLAPDGARLFDRPLPYRGGPQKHFQRAESSSYFGREIGLMYMHAHLRYAEAMARLGDAEAFFLALRQANPVGITDVVAAARRRQANCYHSSSDADFADRYDAAARYEELRAGRVPLEGGWRVYSSGAGIACRIVHQCLLGIRRSRSWLTIDPVLPPSLDGLRAKIDVGGQSLDLAYRVGRAGCGPTRLELDGAPLDFERASNPYRTGGARVSLTRLRERVRPQTSTLVVYLGGEPSGGQA